MKKFSVHIEKKFPKLLCIALLIVAVVALPRVARAQTTTPMPSATSNFSVGLTVTGGCTITSNVSSLNLGSTEMLSAPETGTLPISVTCSNGIPYTVEIGAGTAGSVTSRVMTEKLNASGAAVSSGAATIPYFLYQDTGSSTPWGGTSSTGEQGTGTGVAQTLDVYVVVPASATAPAAGTYGDYLPVTVVY